MVYANVLTRMYVCTATCLWSTLSWYPLGHISGRKWCGIHGGSGGGEGADWAHQRLFCTGLPGIKVGLQRGRFLGFTVV